MANPTVRLAAGTLGGTIQGNFGIYQVASDNTITVDARDAPALIAKGAAYLSNVQNTYTTPAAPLGATVGRIIASNTLSNGTISISNQPDVMRQVNWVWSTGTIAISAGSVAITYVANDGNTYTESVALALAASTSATHSLSRGVTSISAPVVTGLTGGAAMTRQMDITAFLGVPVNPAAQDYHTVAEAVGGVFETGGWSDSVSSIGCVSPLTAPNGTHLYSMFYTFVAPLI